MLNELRVTNFAIIDKVSVTFKNGFNVLSGETGSGKSVLLKSLALLMGEKADSDTIKHGKSQATVEGRFDISKRKDIQNRLSELGIEDLDQSLVVRRVLSDDGKNRIYVNGALSTLGQLRDIVSPLVEVTGHPIPLIELTGQHENRNLQSKAYHLDMLDQYLGLLPLREEHSKVYTELEALKDRIATLEEDFKNKSQRLDFLSFQREEIEALNLKHGDDESLESESSKLKNAEKLGTFAAEAEASLYSDEDSALVRIHRILSRGQELCKYDLELKKNIDSLAQAKTLLEESLYDLRAYGQSLSHDPEGLLQVEERLSMLRKLQRKHGSSVEEILKAYEDIVTEMNELENSDTVLEALKEQSLMLQKKSEKLCESLHQKRVAGSHTLESSVNAELDELNMKGVLFSVSTQKNKSEPGPYGYTTVEYLIQTSKKDAARSLAKFASGGELSRILLSLKRVVGKSEHPRTYLFDEVDAGVSGVTAEKVGRKLKSIAYDQQVICVTHLPQVAAFADFHYVIEKISSNKGAEMKVHELDSKAQVDEIARMLSGEKVTKASLSHAKELKALSL